MKLIKRNSSLTPSYSNLVDHFFNDDFFNSPVSRFERNCDIPASNVVENDDEFSIELAVSGMKKDDFSIKLDNNVLTISSENKKEDKIKEDNYIRREFSYSSFSRSFQFPEGKIDEDKIKASYKDGILTLSLPKKEEHRPQSSRMIEIA